MNVKEIEDAIMNLSYEDKASVYSTCFGFGTLTSPALNDKLILISLIALTANKLKDKDPNLKTIDILRKIVGKDEKYFQNFLEGLAIKVDDLSSAVSVFDPCGLKSSNEIINKIKELLNTWLPF